MSAPSPDEELITLMQAADLYGWSYADTYKRALLGAIPGLTSFYGNVLRIRLHVLISFMDNPPNGWAPPLPRK